MTFVEAAIEILKQEGRPLSVKKLTELAIARKLLSLVGKDPEGQMQARLTAEVKKTTGETPLNRGSAAGIFGLKVFPPRSAVKPPPAPEPEPKRAHHKDGDDVEKGKRKPAAAKAAKPKAKPEKAPEKAPPGARGSLALAKEPQPRRGRAKPEAEVAAAPAAPAARNRDDEGPRRRRRRGGGGGAERHAAPAQAAAPALESELESTDADAGPGEFAGENTQNDSRPPLPAAPEPPREPSRPPVTMSFDQAAVRVREEGRPGEPQAYARPEPRPQPEYRAPQPAPERVAPPSPEPTPYQAPPQAAPMSDAGAFADEADDGEGEGDEERDEGDDQDQPQDQGGEGELQPGAQQGQGPEGDQPGQPPRPRQPEVVHISRDQQAFRSVPLADAAHEVLRTQADGRPVHYRQIADMAVKRRLVRPDAPDIWRALRAAMLQESRDRQSQGLRPRIRHHGNGLFALATRRLEPELVNAEKELAAKHAELRALTRIALRRRLVRLPQTAFEHLVRVLLERAGYSELAMVKRGEGVTYYSAAQSRGALGVKTLVGMRAGEGELGRKAVGELRAGVRVKQLDEGLLVGAGKLSPDGTQEARAGLAVGGAAITAIDGDALADLLIRHGVGVLKVQLPVEYLDPELFADLSEG